MQKSNKQEQGKEEKNYTCKTSTEKAGLEEESSRHARHRSCLLLLPFFSAFLWKFLRHYICYCVNKARIRERGRDVACGKGPGQEVDGEDRGFRLSQCLAVQPCPCPRVPSLRRAAHPACHRASFPRLLCGQLEGFEATYFRQHCKNIRASPTRR